jgi:hypothetical protein
MWAIVAVAACRLMVSVFRNGVSLARAGIDHLADVAARAERGAVAGDGHGANLGVLVAADDGIQQPLRHIRIERIVGFRPIEGDPADVAGDVGENRDIALRGHGVPPCRAVIVMSAPAELRSMSRATIWRMISEVPSRIRMARTSRQVRIGATP